MLWQLASFSSRTQTKFISPNLLKDTPNKTPKWPHLSKTISRLDGERN